MIDKKLYAEAWRSRRRRFACFKTIQIAGLLVILAGAYFASRLKSSLFLLPLPIWFLGYLAVGIWLNRFRCPRCGQLYYWNLRRQGYMERLNKWRECHHCGLQQDGLP
ncbi:hypothetical protein [Nevskia soli]|uniref:hypothetical protein n=1 Tax=Nevskia soli TaxID=418856 RepID=UPI0012FBB954|nr:hypothetical protein [Nevskia soli]